MSSMFFYAIIDTDVCNADYENESYYGPVNDAFLNLKAKSKNRTVRTR